MIYIKNLVDEYISKMYPVKEPKNRKPVDDDIEDDDESDDLEDDEDTEDEDDIGDY